MSIVGRGLPHTDSIGGFFIITTLGRRLGDHSIGFVYSGGYYTPGITFRSFLLHPREETEG